MDIGYMYTLGCFTWKAWASVILVYAEAGDPLWILRDDFVWPTCCELDSSQETWEPLRTRWRGRGFYGGSSWLPAWQDLESPWIQTLVGRTALSDGNSILWAAVLDCVQRRKYAKHQNVLLPSSQLWMKRGQMLRASVAMFSSPWWTVSLKLETNINASSSFF